MRVSSSMFSIGGSLYSLLIISIDRYLAIICPLKYKKWVTAERAYKIVFFIWFFIFFRAAIPAMGWNVYNSKLPIEKRCSLTYVYDPYYYSFVINWPGRIVFTISLFINIHIALIVRKQIRSFQSERSVWTSEQIKNFDARISSVKITLILTALFLVLWFPLYVYTTLRNNNMLGPRATAIMRTFMSLCLTANSMVNAPIYAAIRSEYRDVYKTMLTAWPWHWRKELRGLHRVRNTSHLSSYKSEMSTAKSVESGPEEKFEEEIHDDKVSVVSKQETVVSDGRQDSKDSNVDTGRDSIFNKPETLPLGSSLDPARSLDQHSKAKSFSGSERSGVEEVRSVSTVLEKLDPR
ncbi:adenosine receptor A2b-like [Physella acuta]|uniref:adenosine receptor A2b-like n=1 Tax=Physella acuta TaxID=109671 RepID=UPI0027DD0287|nr:adenosine receptor A2b-like [Physella acuta]